MAKDPIPDSCLSYFFAFRLHSPPVKVILENTEVAQKEVLSQPFFLRHSDLI